ncbi:hypothetical protein FBU30_011267 [Linnemannia zychae]|nr:hypothetical protein FBU30_011267 [Linnemannia zychae]
MEVTSVFTDETVLASWSSAINNTRSVSCQTSHPIDSYASDKVSATNGASSSGNKSDHGSRSVCGTTPESVKKPETVSEAKSNRSAYCDSRDGHNAQRQVICKSIDNSIAKSNDRSIDRFGNKFNNKSIGKPNVKYINKSISTSNDKYNTNNVNFGITIDIDNGVDSEVNIRANGDLKCDRKPEGDFASGISNRSINFSESYRNTLADGKNPKSAYPDRFILGDTEDNIENPRPSKCLCAFCCIIIWFQDQNENTSGRQGMT